MSRLPYGCAICDIGFATLAEAKAHWEKFHAPIQELPYSCSICKIGFATLGEAQDHYEIYHKPTEPVVPVVPAVPVPYPGTHAKMLPIPILFYALLRLRKKVIKEYIHKKLHPWM